eukprot:scaffold122791_cov33-Attheya_sp.AAC.3
MVEPTALRLHDNQSYSDQLGYAVHQTAVQTMAHLKPKCPFLERYGVKMCANCSSEREICHRPVETNMTMNLWEDGNDGDAGA